MQNYWSPWDFAFMMYKSNWKLILIKSFVLIGFLVCDRLRSNFSAFAWRFIYMMAERVVVLLKKRLISGNFVIWTVHVLEKSIILMSLSSSRDIFTTWIGRETQWYMFLSISGRHVGPYEWAPGWRIQLTPKRKQKSKTQIKKENGSAKQNGSKQEKREGPELRDCVFAPFWSLLAVPQKSLCFAVVAEQSLALQMRNTAQSVEHNIPQTNQPTAITPQGSRTLKKERNGVIDLISA